MKINTQAIIIISIFALLVQILIISFNHFNGYVVCGSFAAFFVRVLIGWFFSIIFAFALLTIDLFFINLFDKLAGWQYNFMGRLGLEMLIIIFTGAFVAFSGTVLVHSIFPYKESVARVIINNILIVIVINIIIVTVIEALLFFKRSRESQIKAESLIKENAIMKLDIVKNQLNPHFLFNSLNTLSALIEKDHEKSQDFIMEFSSVYRYILDILDKNVVELSEEINFTKSYFYLQKIRFSDLIEMNISIEPRLLEFVIPPLSLQILVENAIKHNKISKDKKLIILIKTEEENIVVKNNLSPKLSGVVSKGVGLENLRKRYKHLFDIEPTFIMTENEYIAKLPLIEPQ